MAKDKKSKDRRIQKTQALLHEALGSLIREKPYDDIVVKEILDRANVGRSTFYMHFSDKDELLATAIHEMLGTVHTSETQAPARTPERIIRFSVPFFEHIHRHREAGVGGMGPRGRAIVHEHLRKVLAEQVAQDIGKVFQGRRKPVCQIPPGLLVQYVASTFVVVLDWWVESNSALSPKQVNDLFRALVVPSLTSCLE